jgi:hypothetical protein
MKRTLTLLILLASTNVLFAQDTVGISKRVNVKVADRGSDHLMIQYGYDKWAGAPDSIRLKGSSRHFNVYFLFDKPFKTSPKLSVAYGLGIGSSSMFFNGMYVDIKANSATLPFRRVDTLDHFKKYKLTTIYVEAPVELRFSSNPSEPNSSFKFALGAKVGTMLKAFTKGKDLQNKNGASLYGNRYIVKESEKKYFNGTKLAVTGRIGYGIFSLHADYQVTPLLKENVGPEIRPWAIGLTNSGL